MSATRLGALGLVLVLLALAAWRNVGQMQAEALAEDQPERALAWRPQDPGALQALAERQLAAGDAAAAQATARRLLAAEPMHGPAYRLLAQAAERAGQADRLPALYALAARRAPRDIPTRAWLAQHHLTQGDFPQALEHIDRMLRLDPQRAPAIQRALVQLAQDPGFAEALAAALRQDPPWRGGVLSALGHPKTGHPGAAGQVMQALQDQGGLSAQEYAGWLDSLIAQGRWGEAYARWAAQVPKPGGQLPLIYNGGFEQPPSGAGFDWRVRRVPGVLVAFEQVAGTQGNAAHLQFLGRRTPGAGLEQALILSPGRYTLELRQRAEGLRSGLGLQWQVGCVGKGGVIGRSEPVEGSFGWQAMETQVTVPTAGCPGQWLRLVNPVGGGGAQQVAGQLWVDNVTMRPHP